MFFGSIRQKKILPCLLCSERFSVQDIAEGKYFVSTGVCFGCYERKQKSSYVDSCFGKNSVLANGLVLYGYNPKIVVCGSICQDKEICKLFLDGSVRSK